METTKLFDYPLAGTPVPATVATASAIVYTQGIRDGNGTCAGIIKTLTTPTWSFEVQGAPDNAGGSPIWHTVFEMSNTDDKRIAAFSFVFEFPLFPLIRFVITNTSTEISQAEVWLVE